jgi:O-antigen/teichoic acid export membrane protein
LIAAATSLQVVIRGLAAVLPFLILREFARRFAFAHFHAARALALDAAVAAIQLGGLLWLAAAGELSATRAYLVIGFACAVGGSVCLVLRRREFRFRNSSWPIAAAKNWRFGRWVFGGQLVSQLNSDLLILWLLVFVLGESAAGVFAACVSIVCFSNPFILGVSHILTPRIARSLAEGGRRGLRRAVAVAALLMTGSMFVFCIAVAVLGGLAIRLLYGDGYAGHELTTILLAVSVLVQSLGMAIGSGLWALDRPEINFQANLMGLGVTLVTAAGLIAPWGIAGTAAALVAGHAAQVLVRGYRFHHLTSGVAEGAR